ncbi:cation:proton antiporter [Candidatus Micrarchaeota archaeon]|nr:cation:proton antiporter [Candidatus Micrarchaeota archaeon]
MANLGVEGAFLILGGILFIGYLGELLSKRFNIPSVLILLLMGYGLKLSGYLPLDNLLSIQDLFGSLALIVLLFDGGLSLNLYSVIFKSGRILFMSTLVTILVVTGSAALFYYVFHMDPLIGAIFGAIAGGIGSTTTISIVRSLKMDGQILNFLTLESSITDVYSIILTIVLTQALISGVIDIQTIGQGIASTFSTGAVIGVIIGLLYITFLSKIERGYSYMMTFAVVMILYSLTNFLGGSGAISVLIFGILLGNEKTIRTVLHLKETKKPIIKEFQSEISFFIRTFFFVYLGAIVTLGSLNNFLLALALILLFYLLRYISILISTYKSPISYYNNLIAAINPRGLATAVLATYPLFTIQSEIAEGANGHLTNLINQLSNLPEIAFYTIILSIILTTIFVPLVVGGLEKQKNKTKINGNGKKTGE